MRSFENTSHLHNEPFANWLTLNVQQLKLYFGCGGYSMIRDIEVIRHENYLVPLQTLLQKINRTKQHRINFRAN